MVNSDFKNICELYAGADHETVVFCSDDSSHYRGIIAIHSTSPGPAVGGTRFWNYASDEEAILDVLRLSKMMSYKTALAGLPFGGGKAVIIGDNQTKDRDTIFRAHGRFVDSLEGRFITAEDIGTSPSDMEIVRSETRYVAGLPGRSGDPSPITAYGVFMALQACAKHRWDTKELSGRTVAIQGCGNTGYNLAKNLAEAGARLLVSDLDEKKVQRLADEFGAIAIGCDEILSTRADILAPCAFGGVINDQTVEKLKVEIIVGSANNQLSEARHGDLLDEMGILYAPDYLANAGGVINGCRELLDWDEASAMNKVEEIYDTMLNLLDTAGRERQPPFRIADRIAEERLSRKHEQDLSSAPC